MSVKGKKVHYFSGYEQECKLGTAKYTHIDTCTYMRTYNIGTIHVVFDIYIIYIQCPTYIIHFKIYVHIYVYVYTYMYTHMKFFFHLGKEGAV